MGTNYYSVRRSFEYESADLFWDRHFNEDCIHIGKSSMGWCFSLHVIPDRGINSLGAWVPILTDPERAIIDEYVRARGFCRLR